MIDEAESTLSNVDIASDRMVQSVLKQAQQSGNFSTGQTRSSELSCCMQDLLKAAQLCDIVTA